MATFYFKSCCDNNTTFIITQIGTPLSIGDSYHIEVPNYFTGCSEVIPSSQILPGSPTYNSNSVTFTGPYSNCGVCNITYPCQRITATTDCNIVTILPLSISCSANSITSTITITVSGGTPPYLISWSNGFSGPTLTKAKPGENYTITVTDYNWPNSGPDFTATTICGLPLPSPTPTPTPTITPSPKPANSQILCFSLTENRNTTLLTFQPTQNIVNGKFTWSSSTYTLQWGLLPQPSWQVTIGNSFYYNTNSSSPLGFYSVLGPAIQGLMSNGICTTPVMTLSNISVKTPACIKPPTGSIIIETLNAQPPVLYSINGGITTQSTPIFNGLSSGSYNIWVQDSVPTTLTSTAIIQQPNPAISYTLVLDSFTTTISTNQKRLNFILKILNSQGQQVTQLPTGTVITFDISQINRFSVTNNSSFGSRIVGISILKNGSPISITPTISTQTPSPLPVNALCGGGVMEYTTARTTNYVGVTISNTDVISGFVDITVNNISNQACYVRSLDKFTISNPVISGCSCCNVGGLPSTLEMETKKTGGAPSFNSWSVIRGNDNCTSLGNTIFIPIQSITIYTELGKTPSSFPLTIYTDSSLTTPYPGTIKYTWNPQNLPNTLIYVSINGSVSILAQIGSPC